MILNFNYPKTLGQKYHKTPAPNVSCPPSTFILRISYEFKCMLFDPSSQIRCDI